MLLIRILEQVNINFPFSFLSSSLTYSVFLSSSFISLSPLTRPSHRSLSLLMILTRVPSPVGCVSPPHPTPNPNPRLHRRRISLRLMISHSTLSDAYISRILGTPSCFTALVQLHFIHRGRTCVLKTLDIVDLSITVASNNYTPEEITLKTRFLLFS